MDVYELIKNIKINSCGISDCRPEWTWDTGACGFCDSDLWSVIRGKGTITDGDAKYEADAGTSLLLAPGRRYIGTHDVQKPLLVINVHFDFGAVADISVVTQVISKRLSDPIFMRDILYRTVHLFNRDSRELAREVFKTALAEFFGMTSPGGEIVRTGTKRTVIRKICDSINTEPALVPPLSGLAAEYGYSPDYLGRMFSEEIGIPLSRYVINAKINKAKLMLRSSDCTVESVAELLGYYDSCYFIRQFKRETGLTPGEYRKGERII